jgi:hypothetical protein
MNGRTTRLAGPVALALGLTVGVASVSACGDDDATTTTTTTTTTEGDAAAEGAAEPVIDPGDGGDYRPEIDPAAFVAAIDNPYLPLIPGSRWVYEGTDGGETERIEVEVTNDRREVMGVSTTVVRDTVYVDGELAEDTFDWFAQDRDGDVWYMGEDTREYENGEVSSTEGSWEAGVDGALPGIIMQAQPTVDDAYRQEYYAGEAEDLAQVTALDASESVPFGDFDNLLVIKEWNPFEPEVTEDKYFAPGVGTVLEVKTAGGEGRVELLEFTPAPAQG